jgi:DNA-binding MarR family transcriptional regulator
MDNNDQLVITLRSWVEVFMRLSMRQLMQYSHESGLSMQQIRALFHIHDCPRGITNIGDHLGITKAAASQMIDKMVEQGLMTRVEDPQDRRGKNITLTEKGLLAMQKSLQARQGWLENLAASFSVSEKEQVSQALASLVEKARRIESGLPN